MALLGVARLATPRYFGSMENRDKNIPNDVTFSTLWNFKINADMSL
jgi:hypothetical protein